jgi:hypothetical protein
MANTPNFGDDYPVTIPTLTDAADIAVAFKMYHNGSTDGSIIYANSVAGALETKAPINSPTFTGTVVLPDDTIATGKIQDGAITSEKIANGAITNDDINIAAAIAQSKISGLSTSLGLKADLLSPTFTGTVTANNLTVNGTLSATATNAVKGANYDSGFVKITVLPGSTGPANPAEGDIWIQV